MKKLFSGFLLAIFCVSASVADTAVTPSRTFPSTNPATNTAAATSNAAPSRTAITRSVAAAPTGTTTNSGSDATVARTASRTMVSAPATDANQSVRSAISRSGVAGDAATQRETLENTIRTVGRSARTESASINSSAAARRAGVTLRPSTAEVGGRATISGTDIQTGSNLEFDKGRAVQSRAAVVSAESIADATQRLQQTAELNKSCQEQYNDCMDQFCAVVDANQKRCSCSGNLSRYTKSETAVKDANSQLNDVAQRIRYVGLSADEISAIMSATEAEEALSGSSDNTESRQMLEEIEALIKNPTSSTSYTADTYSGLDLDLDFSADTSDLFSLDFLGTTASSFSNLRGTNLYNAAKKRCNTVLNQCKGAGATTQQITGNYDLAIDKDCIAYEQGLTKMNETLVSNVRSATLMLQKARLAVLQNKNQYDAKGCIAALNTCMMDDMVCGASYEKCVDPTKKYIDENGKVVLGQKIADITEFMIAYNNATIDAKFLEGTKNLQLTTTNCKPTYDSTGAVTAGGDGNCIVKYLLDKISIGSGQTVKDGGLCRAVLDKCQNVTYDSNGGYKPYNEVVVNYIQRAMVNINAAQQKIISDYAGSCMVDVAACYNQQVSQVNAWSSGASTDSIYNVMRGACRNVALTCAYAIFAAPESDSASNTACIYYKSGSMGATSSNETNCINNISEMFYQSLLCPDNSMYQSVTRDKVTPTNWSDIAAAAGWTSLSDELLVKSVYVNDRCICLNGYQPAGGTCSSRCGPGKYRPTNTNACTSCPAGTWSDGNNNDGLDPMSCISCPTGTTSSAGSTSASACVAP